MSSQEVVDFVHDKLKQQEQSGDPVCLSSIVEEVSDNMTQHFAPTITVLNCTNSFFWRSAIFSPPETK